MVIMRQVLTAYDEAFGRAFGWRLDWRIRKGLGTPTTLPSSTIAY